MLTDEAGEHYSAAGGFLRSTSTHYLLLREADLKVTSKFGEARKLEELLAGGWLVDNLVLKHPGEVMGNEDSIQTGCEGRVDVRAWTVADHPGVACIAAVMRGKRQVRLLMFFRQNLYRREVRGKTGAMQLVGLLRLVSFGDKDEAMTNGKFAECRRHVGEELNLVFSDGLGKAFDAAVLFFGHGYVGELLKAGDQRFTKALKSVAVGADSVVFDSIKVASDFFSGVYAVIEIGDETDNRALEIDVVFPKGVICIDQQSLITWATVDQSRGAHGLIIKVPLRQLIRRCGRGGMPRLGDISPVRAMQELRVRMEAASTRLERWLPIRAVSECCYQVRNPLSK